MIYYLRFYALSVQSYAESEESVVFILCKITELIEQRLKVEILHDLKEFGKNFLNFKCFYNNVGLNLFLFPKNSPRQSNLALKCQIV